MSDALPDLPRPEPPASWRDRWEAWAETFDLAPGRLAVGAAAVLVVGFLGWKLLEPPAPPPEARLPFASTTVAADAAASGSGSSVPGGAVGSAGGPGGSAPPTSGAGVVVHVAGAVGTPGVQRLPDGARVVDAVDAAGGANPDADLRRINLAARLEDGQQVYVPTLGEEPLGPVGSSGSAGTGSASDGPGGSSDGPVDLNRASVDELDDLPGVGPAIAQAIVDHRDQHGRFSSVEQLIEVRGIGEAKLEQLRPLVTV